MFYHFEKSLERLKTATPPARTKPPNIDNTSSFENLINAPPTKRRANPIISKAINKIFDFAFFVIFYI